MFVRNSATRSSLSERMKGLGRDVKKKISRLKPNRMSKDAEDVSLMNIDEIINKSGTITYLFFIKKTIDNKLIKCCKWFQEMKYL